MTADAKAILGHISGGRVLDAATGFGTFIDFLIDGLRDYTEIVGIDTDPKEEADFVARHVDHPDVRFEVMDVLDPTYPSEAFDTVALAYALCQFEDPARILARLVRLVRPGGHVIVVAPFRDLQAGAALTYVAMHDWWAEVDRACQKAHWPELRRDELVSLVSALDLADLRLTDLVTDGDPMDPTRLSEIDGVTVRAIARVDDQPDLQAQGEVLRGRMREVGFLGATTLAAVGRRPL